MKTILTNDRLEIETTHANCHLIEERIFRNGLWWTLTDCQSHGSFLTAIYRISGYQN